MASGADFLMDAAAAPPPPAEVDFGSAPMGDALPAFEDFPAVPPPADFGAEELPPPPPMDFGEVDFGDAAAPAPASGSTDGLESLSFIDDADKGGKAEGGKVRRFHIRRRTGKIFGPFEQDVVVKMLEDGQLLGNEEVSTDGDHWSAIGAEPAFGAAMQKLMESGPAPSAAAAPSTQDKAQAAGSVEKLKQLYEGRMAAVTVVEGSGSVGSGKKKWVVLGVAAALVVLVGAGGSLHFTRYGAFGMKVLFPAKIEPGSPQFAALQKARAALETDTAPGYKLALDEAAKILKAREYPEARAVWAQAAAYLQRKHQATQIDAKRLSEVPEELKVLGEKNVDAAKALAGLSLRDQKPDDALRQLQEVLARSENAKDVELACLVAEAQLAKKQPKQARDALTRALKAKPNSAKALYALGKVELLDKKPEAAAKAFEDALKADPQHLASAIELGFVQLKAGKVEEAVKTLAPAVTKEGQAALSPSQKSRALLLQGLALKEQRKFDEAVEALEQSSKLDPTAVETQSVLGRVYLSKRDFAKAVPLLSEAAKREPGNVDFVDAHLTALVSSQQYEDALKAVEAANAKFPASARIAYLYGRVTDALNRAADAESHYKRALAADPELVEAKFYLARLYLSQKRLDEARAPLEEALAKTPDEPLLHAGAAELALAENKIEQAQASYAKALTLDEKQAEPHLGLSRIALMQGRNEAALAEVNKALELQPGLPGGNHQRGLVLWEMKKLPEAVKALDAAADEDPRSDAPRIAAGAVRLDMNDLNGAETAFRIAMQVDRYNAKTHFYFARTKSRKSEHSQAIDSMQTALTRSPKNPDYHHEMGLIYRNAGRMGEALGAWTKAVELQPDHVEALQALGEAYLDKGDVENALKYLTQTLKVDPSRARVMMLMGDAHAQAGKWELAIGRYQEALKKDPNLVSTYYKIAQAFTERGDHQKAVIWYRKATVVEPQNPMPYRYLGFAFKERRQKQEAITAFKTYLAKRPDAEDKKDIEDEIYDLQQR